MTEPLMPVPAPTFDAIALMTWKWQSAPVSWTDPINNRLHRLTVLWHERVKHVDAIILPRRPGNALEDRFGTWFLTARFSCAQIHAGRWPVEDFAAHWLTAKARSLPAQSSRPLATHPPRGRKPPAPDAPR